MIYKTGIYSKADRSGVAVSSSNSLSDLDTEFSVVLRRYEGDVITARLIKRVVHLAKTLESRCNIDDITMWMLDNMGEELKIRYLQP